MTIEFLDDRRIPSRPARAVQLTLVSGFLGFRLGIVSLIMIQPSSAQPLDASLLTAPSIQLSDVERGRRADAARLQALADRWLSEGCTLTDPRNLGSVGEG
jgi:hypothetical protein